MHSELPTVYANYPTTDLLALWESIQTEGIHPELRAPKHVLLAMKSLLQEYGVVPWPISQPWKLNTPVARHMQNISFFSHKS